MNLTSAQKVTLKNDINGRAAVAQFVAIQNWPQVAIFYNGAATPTVNVWNPAVNRMVIKAGVTWNAFIGLTVQQQNTYMAIMADQTLDATDKGTMHGLVGLASAPTDGVFVDGSASSVAIRASCIRPATYMESVLSALGTGTLVTSNICQLDANNRSVFGQLLADIDVYNAMNGL